MIIVRELWGNVMADRTPGAWGATGCGRTIDGLDAEGVVSFRDGTVRTGCGSDSDRRG